MPKEQGKKSLESHTKHYLTFDENLWKLAYFLGTTEKYYDGKVKQLTGRLQRSKSELDSVETELDDIIDKIGTREPTGEEEQRIIELDDMGYDLIDTKIFVPMDLKLFRQFPELLRILGLVYLVAIFESYLVDVVRDILLVSPDTLKSSKPLTAETILNLGKPRQIVKYLVEMEINELLYKSFPDMVKYFDKKFNIDLNSSGVTAENIVGIMQVRNIHVHNGGVVNQRFLDSVKSSKSRVGTYKPITQKFLENSISSILLLVKFIDEKVKTKYFSNSDASLQKT